MEHLRGCPVNERLRLCPVKIGGCIFLTVSRKIQNLSHIYDRNRKIHKIILSDPIDAYIYDGQQSTFEFTRQ